MCMLMFVQIFKRSSLLFLMLLILIQQSYLACVRVSCLPRRMHILVWFIKTCSRHCDNYWSLPKYLSLSERKTTFIKGNNRFSHFSFSTSFYRLTNFCRDGTIMSSEVNREAWKIISTIIYYHQGTIDYMNKSNLINPILDLIATFSHNVVITNGLLCLGRVCRQHIINDL